MIRTLRTTRAFIILVALCSASALGQNPPAARVEVVKVVGKKLSKIISLPGDLYPYQSVAIYPKLAGFIESIPVDRGSWLKRDDLIATLTVPELASQRAEAEAKVLRIESQRAEAEARLASSQATYGHLRAAAQTPGVIAGNDLEVAQKTVDAELARVESLKNEMKGAEAAVRSVKDLEGYLKIAAPFDGVITERNAHPGSLVGPSPSPGNPPLVRIEEVSRLRLTVPVPEAYAGSIVKGTRVTFTVPAFPNEKFQGVVQRSAHTLDVKTRTMLVEQDVDNLSLRLTSGMFADVSWPITRSTASVFVPPSSIVSTTERTFVIRVRNNVAEWVDVRRGVVDGNLVEVFGALKADDVVVRRGSDELRNGFSVK